ncbi:hypothetical protein PHMEG_00038572 [Phytophthora megakarya]|uniref:RNase H type-1 domain-containing protein n=1 Tax=Phytophthora megakarya TaxID=4795 RepID=A0A225UIM3_9STRA|nr:hypothetical protein PHMEG_00038572 [Phytophthora megakarya]
MGRAAVTMALDQKDCPFTRLLQSTVTNFVDIDDSLELVAPPQRGSPTARIDPQLLYAKLPLDYSGFVVSFDGSAKAEKNGGYGSCAWVVWRLPEWTIVLAASAYLESTTVNVAEYTGMNNGACNPTIPRVIACRSPIELSQATDVKAKISQLPSQSEGIQCSRGLTSDGSTGIEDIKSGI